MRFKRVICMLLMTMLVSSCKIAHELALSKKPPTDEIVLTEAEPGKNTTVVDNTKTTPPTEELPQEIAGHKVTYTADDVTSELETTPTNGEASTKTNWLLIGLIALPPLLILLYVINKRIAKKLNENG